MSNGGNNVDFERNVKVNSGNIIVDSGLITTTTSSATKNLNDSLSIGQGNTPNHSLFNFFGQNTAIGPTEELIWGTGGTPSLFDPGYAEKLQIRSSDVNDTSAGTGARTIFIAGFDYLGDAATELVTLNGTTNVLTTTTWLRVNRLVVATAGSTKSNEGTILARNNSDTFTVNAIQIGQNLDDSAGKAVGNDQTLFLKTLTISSDSDATLEIVLKVGFFGLLLLPQLRVITTGARTFTIDLANNASIASRADILFFAKKIGGGVDANVTIHVQGVLIK